MARPHVPQPWRPPVDHHGRVGPAEQGPVRGRHPERIRAVGDPVAAGQEPTARAEIRLFTAAVLRQVPEEPLQPVPIGPVWLADDADVLLALRMDSYTGGARPSRVPRRSGP